MVLLELQLSRFADFHEPFKDFLKSIPDAVWVCFIVVSLWWVISVTLVILSTHWPRVFGPPCDRYHSVSIGWLVDLIEYFRFRKRAKIHGPRKAALMGLLSGPAAHLALGEDPQTVWNRLIEDGREVAAEDGLKNVDHIHREVYEAFCEMCDELGLPRPSYDPPHTT